MIELCCAGLQRGAFTQAKFARDGSLGLFTVVKLAGDAHLVAWLQGPQGDVAFRAAAKAHSCPVTSFDVSNCGAFLGTGSSEGDVRLHAVCSGWPAEVLVHDCP